MARRVTRLSVPFLAYLGLLVAITGPAAWAKWVKGPPPHPTAACDRNDDGPPGDPDDEACPADDGGDGDGGSDCRLGADEGSTSGGPIFYATGLPAEDEADLVLRVGNLTWAHRPTRVSRPATDDYVVKIWVDADDPYEWRGSLDSEQLTIEHRHGGTWHAPSLKFPIDLTNPNYTVVDLVSDMGGDPIHGAYGGDIESSTSCTSLSAGSSADLKTEPLISRLGPAAVWPSLAQGNGWVHNYEAQLEFVDGNSDDDYVDAVDTVYYWADAGHRYAFAGDATTQTGGASATNNRIRSRLFREHAGDPSGTYRLLKPSGRIWLFHGPEQDNPGQLWQIIGVNGDVLTFSYGGDGRLDHVTSSAGQYTQYAYPAADKPLASIAVWRDQASYEAVTLGAKLAEVLYTYVGDTGVSGECGTTGDLVGVEVKTRATTDSGNTLSLVKRKHYRYYQATSIANANGLQYDLRLIFRDQAVQRAIADTNIGSWAGLLAASNSVAQGYASNEFTYKAAGETYDGRVREEIVHGGVACCGGGTQKGTYKYSYQPFTNTGWNSTSMLTQETRPDNSTKWVETNEMGAPRLVAIYADGHDEQQWHQIWLYEWDATCGQIARVYTPAALTRYQPSPDGNNPWLTLRAGGLVHEFGYDAAHNGRHQWTKRRRAATGYLWERSNCTGSVDDTIEMVEYKTWRDYPDSNPWAYRTSVYLAEQRRYPVAATDPNDASALCTTYSYDFYPDPNNAPTDRVKVMTITHPTVSTSQNGSGVATVERHFFDTNGRLRWRQNGEGRLTYYGYDERTGRRALIVTDVYAPSTYGSIQPAIIRDTNASGSDAYVPVWTESEHAILSPAYSTGSSSDYVQPAQQIHYDDLGRVRSRTARDGQVTYYAYLPYGDGTVETHVYPSWDSATNHPRLPIARRYTDYSATSYTVRNEEAYAGNVTFDLDPNTPDGLPLLLGWTARSDFVSLSKSVYDSNDRLTATWRYHKIPAEGDGEVGPDPNNYGLTQYWRYNLGAEDPDFGGHSVPDPNSLPGVGYATEVRSAEGGWTFTVYDVGGNVKEVWQRAETGSTPEPGYVKVRAYAYGENGAGVSVGGPLTWVREYYGGGAASFVQTKYLYDWRERRVAALPFAGYYTAALPHTVYSYDNLGRTVAVGLYSVVDPNSVPIPESTTDDRLALSTTAFDARGRAYETVVYAINVATGDKLQVAGVDQQLITQYYYDRDGRLVAVDPPNAGATVYKYDGAGRETQVFACARLPHTDVPYYDANGAFRHSVVTDKVVEQTEYTLNANGDPQLITAYELGYNASFSTQTGIGDNRIATYTRHWYNAAGQRTTTAYYGTNTGSWQYNGPPTDPNEPAGSAVGRLVTKYTYYADSSRVETVADPNAIVTKCEYDDLGQVLAVVEDPNAPTGTHLNRRTEYAYDLLGNVAQITACAAVDVNPNQGGYENEVTEYIRNDPVDADWVTAIHYPDPDTGAASSAAADSVGYTYNYDGTLATRTDQNGSVLTYTYDGRRRLGAQSATTLAAGVADDVRRIGYTYTSSGQLEQATSYSHPDGGTPYIVNAVRFTYDGFGKLAGDYQAHAPDSNHTLDPNSVWDLNGPLPYVGYTYEYLKAADGYENSFDRLRTIQYPNGRTVWYGYMHTGDTATYNSRNYALSRIGQIADAGTGTGDRLFAQYDFNGLDRLVQRDHLVSGTSGTGVSGNKTALRYRAQEGIYFYDSFDRFGRVIKLRHLRYDTTVDDPNAVEVASLAYQYDRNSNRTAAVTQHNAARSHTYTYDNLNRLTADKSGYYETSGITAEWSTPAEQDWTLDLLGNWESSDQQHSGTSASETRTHNGTNEIETRTAIAQGPLYWVNDNFDDSDTTNWEVGYVADGGDGSWSASSAHVQCDSVVVTGDPNTPTYNGSIFLVPGTYQDVGLSVSATVDAAGKRGGLVFGYVDKDNYWVLMASAAEGNYRLYQKQAGSWALRGSGGTVGQSTYTVKAEVRSGSVTRMTSVAGYDAPIPAGRVGIWSGAANVVFDNFKVRSLAAECVVDGRFTDDVGNVRVSGGKLEFYNADDASHRTVLRDVRMINGIVQADVVWQNSSVGLIVNYQDPENFGVVLLAKSGALATAEYVEFVDGKQQAIRDGGLVAFAINAGTTYRLMAWITGVPGIRTLQFYVNDQLRLYTETIDDTWDGGAVGVYSVGTALATIQWDDFICGIDVNEDGYLGEAGDPDPADYIYAACTFGGNTLTFAHDDNGNLTRDGLYQYQYDAWNRLTGVWYNDGDMADPNECVARYAYDGLFRRTEKTVTNQGNGIVPGSDAGGMTAIQAGDRHEHYFYSGWRLVETTNHASDPNEPNNPAYNYAASDVLNQYVWGTQYLDELVRIDRNTDVATDDDCIDAEGSRSYYAHQDANYRTVMLTDTAGQVVERCEYGAYGVPTIYAGWSSAASGETAGARQVSTVGNPFLHQGLFYDREAGKYQNRFREHSARTGRFLQRDPLYADQLTMYEYLASNLMRLVDAYGLEDDPTQKDIDELLHDLDNGSKGRQEQRKKYGNQGALDPAENQRAKEMADAEAARIGAGLVEAGLAVYDTVDKIMLVTGLAKVAADLVGAGIKVIVQKGVRKFLTKEGKELTETEALALARKNAKDRLLKSLDELAQLTKAQKDTAKDFIKNARGKHDVEMFVQEDGTVFVRKCWQRGNHTNCIDQVIDRDGVYKTFHCAWDESGTYYHCDLKCSDGGPE